MHLLMDARALQARVDGIGRYSLGVIRALMRVRPGWRLSAIVTPDGGRHLEGLPLSLIESSVPRFRPGENRKLAPVIESSGADCYMNFSMAGPSPDIPTVVSIHDIMVLTVPDYFGGNPLKNLSARLVFRSGIRRSVAHAGALPVLSGASLSELVSKFPGARDKAFIAGAGQDLFSGGRQAPCGQESREGLLYVGNARAYKNVTRLIVAYSRLKAMNRDFPRLSMVVRKDRAFPGFMRVLEESPAGDRIQVLTDVPDEQLRRLYRGSLFLVIPSLKEGFGLPALEAMAAGTPVMASRGTALEELVGAAGVLVDPVSMKDIMKGMATLAADAGLRERLAAESLKRASLYSWDRTAEKIAERIEVISG